MRIPNESRVQRLSDKLELTKSVYICDNHMYSVILVHVDLMVLYDCVQLVFGNSGVLQGIQVGKAYVDMSTVDVETMADVFEVQNPL